MKDKCKICDSGDLKIFAHTAKCANCGVLVCYPYPVVRENDFLVKKTISEEERQEIQLYWLNWHMQSGARNHSNFTHMVSFALTEEDRQIDLKVLDYGGGGGQFSLVIKSLFPKVETYIVDMQDHALMDGYRPLNNQILFIDFESDKNKFDVIFLNDVYEHVSDPIGLLKQLKGKLNPGGMIFIDTPCQSWMYPVTRFFSKRIYTKLLKGTVDYDHQQIWSKKSFYLALEKAGFEVTKYSEVSEFTQPANFYLNNMGIKSSFLRFLGHVFVALAPVIAKNKIMSCAKIKAS